jgi:hypothetical protein
MAYFFVVAFWILCCGAGLLAVFFRQLRFLALYLILGLTGAAIFSALIPTVLLLAAETLLHGSGYGWLGILALAISFFGGGVLGAPLGLLGAWRLNSLLGWTKPTPPNTNR